MIIFIIIIIMDVDNRDTRGTPWIPLVVWYVYVRQELSKDVFEMSSEELQSIPMVAFQTI